MCGKQPEDNTCLQIYEYDKFGSTIRITVRPNRMKHVEEKHTAYILQGV